jgi:hypothetical protein
MTAAPYPRFDGTQSCVDADPELFFPGTGADGPIKTSTAIEICEGCHFRRPCLAYALTHTVFGIWGGTTEPTRRAVRDRYGIRAISMEISEAHSPTESESA